MRRSLIVPSLVAGTLIAAACGEDPVSPFDVDPQLSYNDDGARGTPSRQVAHVFAFGDPPTPVRGSSALKRRKRAVVARIVTREVSPRHAYTAWLVIFNNPAGCVEGCGEDDLFNADAAVDVVYLAGRVANRRGRVRLLGRRSVQNKSGSLFAQLGVPSPGLSDPLGAEVHVVVRDHGPLIRGQVRRQLRSFEGGCTPESSFGLGDGPNDCADVQFAVHLPR